MKKTFRFVTALLLTVCMLIPNAIYTHAASEAENNGAFLGEVLKLIDSTYIGSEVDLNQLTEAALRGIMSILDPYSEYLNPQEYSQFKDYLNGTFIGIGITLVRGYDYNLYVESVDEGSSAHKAGIKPGDLLYKVNGQFVTGWELDRLQELLAGFGDKAFKLTVIRNYKALDFTVRREELVYRTILSDTLDELYSSEKNISKLGYIYMSSVGATTGEEIAEAVKILKNKNLDTLILDLRGNPGGYVNIALDICRMLVPKGPIIYIQEKNKEKISEMSKLEVPPFSKVYVLVNTYSASAAEIIASALQDSGIATVIGEETYGKGVIQSIFEIDDGSCIKLTTGEYYRRNGEKLNGIGIIPDIKVVDEAINGKDNCVETVIEDFFK